MSDTFIDKSGRTRKRKTHCKHGHAFTENSPWATNWKGYSCRVCLECQRLRMQRKREAPGRKEYEAQKMREWRKDNPEKTKESWKRSYEKRDAWIRSFKKKCKFCPENRYPCLDFHHRDSGDKLATIGQVRHWSRKRLKTEIDKCDVVCANCHRWHHWVERQKEREQ